MANELVSMVETQICKDKMVDDLPAWNVVSIAALRLSCEEEREMLVGRPDAFQFGVRVASAVGSCGLNRGVKAGMTGFGG
jgi:hypothetical protein